MIALYVVLALLLAFVALLVIRALRFVPEKQSATSAPDIQVDENRLAEHLSKMLQVPTVSYTEAGRADAQAFERFRELLKTLYPKLHQQAPPERVGENGLLFHIRGKSAEKPSVLMAHYDVVPVDEAAWSVPPFSGLIKDGDIWGRGAVDTKCSLLCVLEAAENALHAGFVPQNDVYLSFGGDEETLGQDAFAIVDELNRRGIQPAFVLDEGGAVVTNVFPGVKENAALIGIAEKGSVFIDLVAKGKSGHASAPPARQAVGELSKALNTLLKKPLPFTLTKPAEELFDTLGRHSTFVYKLIFANLWCFAPVLDLICKKSGGELNALVRTTAALTRLSASPAYNVLPGQATAGLNLRLIPGDSMEKAGEQLKRTLGGHPVEVNIVKGSQPSAVSPTTGDAWERLKTSINAAYPEAIVSPYLMVAASDSRHFCRIADNVYRFSGFAFSREHLNMIHSRDERIPVAVLTQGYRFYHNLFLGC